jgi:very-short-patch-repair endonuclease
MSSENNSLSYDDLIKEKARLLRNNSTPAENLFWNTLRRVVFYKPLTIKRQKTMGPYNVYF